MCSRKHDGLATAPINKRALFLGGYSFPHTEFLAHLTAAKNMRWLLSLLICALCCYRHTYRWWGHQDGRADRIIQTSILLSANSGAGVLTVLVGCCGAESPRGRRGLFGVEELGDGARHEACRVDDINVKARFPRTQFFCARRMASLTQ